MNISNAPIDRRLELKAYGDERPEESDGDTGTDALIFHQCYEDGASIAIVGMTNFNPAQIIGICAKVLNLDNGQPQCRERTKI